MMQPRTALRAAWIAFAVVILCFLAGVALAVLDASAAPPSQRGGSWKELALALAMLAFPIVGIIVATRQPSNAIGWILLAIGVATQLPLEAYARYAIVTAPGSLPRPDLVAALTAGMWVPFIGLIGTFLLLLFPDGRLPSPRWRPLARLSALVLIVLTVVIPMSPGSLPEVAQMDFLPRVPNPLGIEALRPFFGALYAVLLLLPLCIVGSAFSLIVRFRRSSGRERLQIKWLAAAATLTALLYLLTMVVTLLYDAEWSGVNSPSWLRTLQDFTIYAFVLIPAAIGFAVLRYRLYDIDVIINRALVYGLLTSVLASAYLGIVVVLQRALTPLTRESDIAVAASTLAVAALFRPARARVQSFIDYRFYRRKYDAEQTLVGFSARLRDQLDLETLQKEVTGVIIRTLHPSHVSLWLPRSKTQDVSEVTALLR